MLFKGDYKPLNGQGLVNIRPPDKGHRFDEISKDESDQSGVFILARYLFPAYIHGREKLFLNKSLRKAAAELVRLLFLYIGYILRCRAPPLRV